MLPVSHNTNDDQQIPQHSHYDDEKQYRNLQFEEYPLRDVITRDVASRWGDAVRRSDVVRAAFRIHMWRSANECHHLKLWS